jgi:hypothetical protein
MKNLIIILVISVGSVFFARSSYGQYWVYVEGNAMVTGGDLYPGMGLKFGCQWGFNEENGLTLGVHYYSLPSRSVDLNANDTLGNFIIVPSTITLGLYEFVLDYRRYLFETDYDDVFGFYVVSGIGLWFSTATLVPGTFDEEIYEIPNATFKYSYPAWRIPIGLGFDFTVMGKYWLYADARMEVPVTDISDSYAGDIFALSFHGNVGVRIPIGK